jgi:hypothetical protein
LVFLNAAILEPVNPDGCFVVQLVLCNGYIERNQEQNRRKTMPLLLTVIAVAVLVAIIAVLLLRPVASWLASEWHAAKCRNYPNRLQ